MPDVFAIIGSRGCCHYGLNRQTVVVLAELDIGHMMSKLITVNHCWQSVRLHIACTDLKFFTRTKIV